MAAALPPRRSAVDAASLAGPRGVPLSHYRRCRANVAVGAAISGRRVRCAVLCRSPSPLSRHDPPRRRSARDVSRAASFFSAPILRTVTPNLLPPPGGRAVRRARRPSCRYRFILAPSQRSRFSPAPAVLSNRLSCCPLPPSLFLASLRLCPLCRITRCNLMCLSHVDAAPSDAVGGRRASAALTTSRSAIACVSFAAAATAERSPRRERRSGAARFVCFNRCQLLAGGLAASVSCDAASAASAAPCSAVSFHVAFVFLFFDGAPGRVSRASVARRPRAAPFSMSCVSQCISSLVVSSATGPRGTRRSPSIAACRLPPRRSPIARPARGTATVRVASRRAVSPASLRFRCSGGRCGVHAAVSLARAALSFVVNRCVCVCCVPCERRGAASRVCAPCALVSSPVSSSSRPGTRT